ncbi:hypothetical protein E1B28_011693 [Marasmius oreades]|uniref:Uncharacterized protein n=1 Tax=Marasmius oreades TaxID=181124 RepID=A0A9P7URG8_9AGAR|nr:uncharacterized protein E1B28_011693 [Marasmius oreades]KAG7090076.1 hypothetical protein E1B28_011693 [Marasmius oreades]
MVSSFINPSSGSGARVSGIFLISACRMVAFYTRYWKDSLPPVPREMAPSSLVILFFVGWTHILLYGFNAVLFVVGMYLLRQRKRREGTMFLVVSSSLLFVLATISAIVCTLAVVGGYLIIPLPGSSPSTSINRQACSIIEFIIVDLIDWIAFIILVYRCFHIWDRRYLVVVAPVLLFLGAVARRIWTLKTCLQDLGHEGIAGILPQKYNSIIAITLESGMIIPTFHIISTVFNVINAKTGAHDDVVAVLGPLLPQIYALAPLIIMIRVALRLTVERHNVGNPTSLSSVSFGARTSQGCVSVPHVLNVHRDVPVSVSVTSSSDLEDLEQNPVLKGQAI